MAHNFKSSAEKNQECMDEGADSQNVEEQLIFTCTVFDTFPFMNK